MATPIGRPVSPTYTPATPPAAKVAPPASSSPALETSKPVQTQASFAAARQSVVGKSTETVNPSQGGAQVKQGIDQVEPGQLLEQGQGLMESPVVRLEFSDGASSLPKLPPPTPPSSLPPPPPPPKISSVSPQSGRGSITPDMLVQAREKLKPISQHQVLNLEKGDTIVTESSRSVVLKDEGSAFAPERLTATSTLEIVGHGSPDGATIGGQTPKQLAQKLKLAGVTQLAVLDLKSCYSAQFKIELEGALKDSGIHVEEVKSYDGEIGINQNTGKVLQGPDLEQSQEHSGKLSYENAVRFLDQADHYFSTGNFRSAIDAVVRSSAEIDKILNIRVEDACVADDGLGILKDIIKESVKSGDLETAKLACRAIYDTGWKGSTFENSKMLIDSAEINTAPTIGRGFNCRADREIYPFSTKHFTSLSSKEKAQISEATVIIQKAVTQAHQEFISGNLAHFHGSGALGAWRRHAIEVPPQPLKATEIGQMIEFRTMNILKSKLSGGKLAGLNFETQVKVPGRSFADAQPDIVLTTGTGKKAYIDVTARSAHSVGHVLGKGGGVLTNGHFLAETTYPNVPIQNIQYDPNKPPNLNLTPDQIAKIELTYHQVAELRASLVPLRAEIKDRINGLNPDAGKLFEKLVDDDYLGDPTVHDKEPGDEVSRREVDRLGENIHRSMICLNGKKMPGSGASPPRGEGDIEQAVTTLYRAIDYWYNADESTSDIDEVEDGPSSSQPMQASSMEEVAQSSSSHRQSVSSSHLSDDEAQISPEELTIKKAQFKGLYDCLYTYLDTLDKIDDKLANL